MTDYVVRWQEKGVFEFDAATVEALEARLRMYVRRRNTADFTLAHRVLDDNPSGESILWLRCEDVAANLFVFELQTAAWVDDRFEDLHRSVQQVVSSLAGEASSLPEKIGQHRSDHEGIDRSSARGSTGDGITPDRSFLDALATLHQPDRVTVGDVTVAARRSARGLRLEVDGADADGVPVLLTPSGGRGQHWLRVIKGGFADFEDLPPWAGSFDVVAGDAVSVAARPGSLRAAASTHREASERSARLRTSKSEVNHQELTVTVDPYEGSVVVMASVAHIIAVHVFRFAPGDVLIPAAAPAKLDVVIDPTGLIATDVDPKQLHEEVLETSVLLSGDDMTRRAWLRFSVRPDVSDRQRRIIRIASAERHKA